MKILYENQFPYYFFTPVNRGANLLTALFVIWFFIVFAGGLILINIRGRYSGLPLGIAISFIGGFILILFLYKLGIFQWGYEVDLKQNIFRKYRGNHFLRFGKWKTIPGFDYLLISKNTNRNIDYPKMRTFSSEYGIVDFYFDLTLITNGDYDVLIYSSPYRDYIIRLAKDLINHFQMNIYERAISGNHLIYSPTQDQHNT